MTATGQAERVDLKLAPVNRWIEAYVYPRGGDRYASIFEDVSERKRAEAVLRASDERQAFLLKLSDMVRPLADPVAIQQATVDLWGRHMDVDRCYYAEFDWTRDALTIHTEYLRTDALSAIGEHPISAFQDLLQFSYKGEPLVCDEIARRPIFGSEAGAYRARRTDGFILMPQIKRGQMVACMCVTMETPRHWKPAEVDLVREVADRTWDAALRARVEYALRENERFSRALVEGVPQLVWRAVDAGHWFCASPQWTDYTGQAEHDSHGNGWLDTGPP